MPGERLKRQFVRCLISMSEPDRGIRSSLSVQGTVGSIRTFLRFVATKYADAAVSMEDLGAELIDLFQDAMLNRYGPGSREPFCHVSRICGLLREVVEEHEVTLGPGLRHRIVLGATCPLPNASPRDAYTSAETKAIGGAARLQVGRVIRRLCVQGPAVLAEGGDPAASVGGWSKPANVVWYLAEHGNRMRRELWRESGGAIPQQKGCPVPLAWARSMLWPTTYDLAPFWVLLLLATPATPAALSLLTPECLANASRGQVTLEFTKHRAGRRHSDKAIRVIDGQGLSPGGLVRNLVRVGAGARGHAGSDSLWVAAKERGGFTVDATSEFRLRQGELSPLQRLADAHDIVWEDPDGRDARLAILGGRLRKTYVAAAYRAAGGDLAATAAAARNTTPVAFRHYGDIESLGPLHAWTVADVLYERVAAARGAAPTGAPVVVGTKPAAPDVAVGDSEVVEVQLAACHGFTDSPYAPAGEGCPVSFTGCLQCANAVVNRDKLPAIVTYLHHILTQRFVMAADDWCAAWGPDFIRIVDDILPEFDRATLDAAQQVAAAGGASLLYLPTVATARRYRHG